MKFVCALWIVVFWEVFCTNHVAAVSSVVVTENVALGNPCNMTSSYNRDGFDNSCATAINGNTAAVYAAGNCIHTDIYTDNNPKWNVDLGHYYNITSIVIYARLIWLGRMPGVSVYIDNSKVYEFDTEPTSAMTTIPISPAVLGRVVSITRKQVIMNFCEVQVFAQRTLTLENVAVNKPCNMSRVYYYSTWGNDYDVFNNPCSAANNNNTSTTNAQGNCIRTHWDVRTPQWTVNLEHVYAINKITIYPTSGGESLMANVMVQVGDNPAQPVPVTHNTDPLDVVLSPPQTGSTVTVFRPNRLSPVEYNYLRFCEVQVWTIPGFRNLAVGKPCDMSPWFFYNTVDPNNPNYWIDENNNTCDAANNGNISTAYTKGNCIYTHWTDHNPHWTVILGTGRFLVHEIVIFRTDDATDLSGLMTNVRVLVDGQVVMTFPRYSSQTPSAISLVTDIQVIPPRIAHNITVVRDDTTPGNSHGYTYMRLCEVQVWGMCEPGFFEDSCDQTCQYNQGCQPGRMCSPLDGHCVCRDGWKSPLCIECAPGRYEKSSDCQKRCAAGCTGGTCNDDGACTCKARWQSPDCDRCDSDHYGQSADCVHQCGAGCVGCHDNGTCKACKQNFDNFPACNQCSRGFYGHNCDSICGQGCEHGTCNRDGTCTCLPNWGPNTPAALCNEIEGLYWEPHGLQESGFLLLCPGENAYFNWTVSAGHRITEILNIEWFYAGNSRELMALVDHDHFIILPDFSGRLQHFGNASIMLSDVVAMDSGNYSVKVIATEVGAGHSTASLYGDVILRVAEEPVLTSHTLVAVENSQAVLDPRTGQWSIELLCGTFQYLGDPPVHMVWQTPNDTKPIASSSYRDGHFRLLLTHPIQGGQYTCLPNTSKNISFPAEDGCLKSSASVTVDGVADTMILYQAEIHDLKNKLNNATSYTCP